MLAPGTKYDDERHRPESAPQPLTPRSQDVATASLKRRHATDGTPYCCCCNTALEPISAPGRPSPTCDDCRTTRRRLMRANYEATRTRQRRRHQTAAPRETSDANVVPRKSGASQAATLPPLLDHPMPANVSTALHRLRDLMERPPRHIAAASPTTWEGRVRHAALVITTWHASTI